MTIIRTAREVGWRRTLRLLFWFVRHPVEMGLVTVVIRAHDLTLTMKAWLTDDATTTALHVADVARRYAVQLEDAKRGANEGQSFLWDRHGRDLEVLLRTVNELDAAARELAINGGPDRRAKLAAMSTADQLARVSELVDMERLPE